jgi:hypothetical protein
MSTVSRRTFFLGLGSVAAALSAVGIPKVVGDVLATRPMPRGLQWRAIKEISISSMPTGEEIRRLSEDPVRYTAYRDDQPVWTVQMNVRATFRWVAMQDGAVVVPEGSILRFEIEPCHTHTQIYLQSDIERDIHPLTRRRMFAETYRWTDKKLELERIVALDVQDASVLA